MPEEVLAKPSGVLLPDHTEHVVEEAERWLDAFPFLEQKYRNKTGGNNLREQLIRAAELHDQGKRHPKWQRACQKDAEHNTSRHLQTADLRHEFASLDYANKKGYNLTLPERAAIAAHHRKLNYGEEHRWRSDGAGTFEEYWNDFYREACKWNQSPPEDQKRQALEERFRISGPRALLQLVDSRASMKEKDDWVPDVHDDLQFSYQFPYKTRRDVQKKAMAGKDEPSMILRAPTGSGKTDAAMLWARHQINENRASRCVLAMPTRFTSNSLAIDLEASVGQTGLYHSSAWQGHYREKSDGDEQQKKAEELHRMARLLATPVTVCTIDHLLLALTGTREEHHTIFYHLCNSCLVLDEADFYDPFVQSNIRLLLKVCHQFDVPVLIMSATVPDAAQSFYDIPKLQDVNESDSREKCRIINAGKAEGPDDIQHLLNEVSTADHKGVIVYANTVHRALAYHDWFRNNTSMETILYHSRFTERDKSRIEKKLLNNLGKTSQEAENENNGCIAVMTQIGEMSLNISAPVMVSDLCPYDRLAQRAGRLGRFNHSSVGTLHVVTPVKDGDLYPAPYGDFDNETSEWQPGEPLVKTNELLEFRPHSPQDFVRKVEEVYPTPEAFCSASSAATDNRERLKQHLEEEWLIVAPKQPDEDTGSTGEWQSRNIPPQVTVLTERPDSFESYAEYRHFVEFKGVSCPAYHVDIGKRLNRVQTVTFHMGDETETALYSSCYSLSEGLILDRDRKQPREDRIVE